MYQNDSRNTKPQASALVILPLTALSCWLATPAHADSWQGRSPAPGARAANSAVWTGREMIVWGGGINGSFLNSGGRYVPATDAWQTTSLSNAPSPRWFHAAVWTGREMIIWGGRVNFFGNDNFNDGARYDPVTDTWRPMTTRGAPTRRSQCAAVWTGSEMIVWGGATEGGVELNDGARYNPETDSWSPLSNGSGLEPRMEPTGVWTGEELIVFGGMKFTGGQASFGNGARYRPGTDTWLPLPAANGPGSRTSHTAVWTGERMIIWGGRVMPAYETLQSGAIYNPGSDTWSPVEISGAPHARMLHAAVWTGSEMIVWGGQEGSSGILLNTGARYNPATGHWTATTQDNAPGKRMFWRPDLGIWTGAGMLICAGSDYPASLDSTSLYLPGTNAVPPPPPPMADYDVSRDYSAVDNPNGPWSYGWKESVNGAFHALPYPKHFFAENGVPLFTWQLSADELPSVSYVVGPGTAVSASGQFVAEPGTLYFTAGADGTPYNLGAIRFTVPSGQAGTYRVETSVRDLFDGSFQGDTDFHVGRNGAELFNRDVPVHATAGYTNVLFLAEGDTVDFLVGRGLDGHQSGSGLKLKATLTRTTNAPPPDTNCISPASGLVGWWPGDGDANDVMAGHNGVAQDGAGFGPGRIQQAFVFEGSNASVRIPAHPSLDVGAGAGLTIELWVNPADLSIRSPLVEWNRNGPGIVTWGVHLYILRPDEFGLGAGNLVANLSEPSGASHLVLAPGGTLSAHSWQHVALTYEKASGRARLYRNGQIVSESNVGSFTPETTYDLYFGRRPSGDAVLSYRGQLDEVSIYNRELSPAEIEGIVHAGAAGKCRPPEPPPTPVYDLSRDYSLASNPNGAWSYGYLTTLGGSFGLLEAARTFAADNGVPIAAWELNTYVNPGVWKVLGPDVAHSDGDHFTAEPGTVYFAPGADGAPQNYGVVRFTAPAGGAGAYRLETRVQSLFDGTRSRDADFHVLRNGQELFGQFLPPNSAAGYTNLLTLAAGDRIDFAIGRGADGLTADTGLKIQATLTLATNGPPPPASPPVILAQPQSQTVPAGGTATFSIIATGAPPLSYHWRRNGTAIPGATNDVLTLIRVSTTNQGLYSVIVTNSFGGVLSSNAVLTVLGPSNSAPTVLAITPTNQTVAVGATASISVTATGAPPLSYQWTFNGTNLSGRSNAILALANVQTSNAGTYRCLVGNSFGSILSPPATLNVTGSGSNGAPIILSPAALVLSNLNLGGNATFRVVAQGASPLGYQWYFNGPTRPLAGANSDTLFLNNLQSEQAGIYTVVVSNALGTATNRGFVANINDPAAEGGFVNFAITPANSNVFVYLDSTNRVPVGASYLAQLYYGVSEDTLQPLPGATGFYLAGRFNGGSRKIPFPAGNQSWLMRVRAWEAAFGASYEQALAQGGRVGESGLFQVTPAVPPNAPALLIGLQSFTLGPAQAPRIIAQPASLIVNEGDNVRLEVGATGAEPLWYEWSFNGGLLGTRTNAVLDLGPVQAGQAGSYVVRVGNLFGSVLSAPATLTVLRPNEPPLAQASISPLVSLAPDQTNRYVICANGSNAVVVLDASRSTDPNRDALQFLWIDIDTDAAMPCAAGALATNRYEAGPHALMLLADDGRATSTDLVSFEVLTPADAVGELSLLVEGSPLSRRVKRPLLETLKAAAASFQRENREFGRTLLATFCDKVRSQVAPGNPILARRLLEACENLSDALQE